MKTQENTIVFLVIKFWNLIFINSFSNKYIFFCNKTDGSHQQDNSGLY